MDQYDFHDLSIGDGYMRFIPSEAMYIGSDPVDGSLTKGSMIEDQVEGYQTLTTEGRELLAYTLATTTLSGADGAAFVGATFPTRKITVNYRLRAPTPAAFVARFEALQRILSQKQFTFWFRDDPDWYYTGTLSDVGDVPAGRLDVTSSFAIECSDPHKYERQLHHETIDTKASLLVHTQQLQSVIPEEITIKLQLPTKDVKITDGAHTIHFIGDFKAADEIVIRPQDMTITLNGESALQIHDVMSSLEDFAVSTGDTITIDPETTKTTIALRGVR